MKKEFNVCENQETYQEKCLMFYEDEYYFRCMLNFDMRRSNNNFYEFINNKKYFVGEDCNLEYIKYKINGKEETFLPYKIKLEMKNK